MNYDPEIFRRELAGWALRGVLCAVPSFFWAMVAEFRQPEEIVAMVAVTGLFVVRFACFSAWDVRGATPGRERFVRALKMSAWIKGALGTGAVGAWALGIGKLGLPFTPWLAIGVVPDMWCGVGSLSLAGWLAGARDLGAGQLDSFGWTGLTTLVQGGLISVLLLLLTAAVLGWWRAWAWLRPKLEFFPARSPG